MNLFLNTILGTYCLLGILFGQFRSDVPIKSLPTNLNGELEKQTAINLFDPNRLSINHSFGISMISNQQNSFSVAGLTNQLTYIASDNLKLDGNIIFYMMKNPIQQKNLLFEQFDIAYNAGITYQPTKNSFLQLRFQNFPQKQRYQNHSPFNLRFIQ